MNQEKDKFEIKRKCRADFDQDMEKRREIPVIVEEIIRSFGPFDQLAHMDAPAMPDEPSIVGVLDLLHAVIFPGYHGRYEIDSRNLVYFIGELVVKIYDELSTQISRAYYNDCAARQKVDCVDCEEYGREKAVQFLKTLPGLRRVLDADVVAAYGGDPAAKNTDEIIFCYPGLKAITIYRIAHELLKLGVPIIPRIMTEYAHRQTGIDIHPGANIGESFFIDHGTGVVIGETTVIGNNVQLYQGVTLGALRFPKDAEGNLIRGIKRHPTIEDNVTIYAQATILGDTTIGEGSVIAGNVWLTHSVPHHSMVANEPVKIEFRENLSKNPLDEYNI